jgi:pyruvate,water dikinase
MESLWDDPRLVPAESMNFRTLRRIVPVLLPVLGRLIRTLLWPDVERARFQHEMETLIGTFEAQVAATSTLSERLILMGEVLDTALRFLLPRFIPRFGAGMAGLNMLNHLAGSLPDAGQQSIWAMTRGVPHNVTTEMDLALWETAKRIKSDEATSLYFHQTGPEALAADYLAGRLPERIQTSITDFMQRYGMRGVGEIDLGRPRWREEPAPIMQIVRSYVQIEDADQAPDAAFERGAASAEAAIQKLAENVRQTRGGRFKARQVRWAERRMRGLIGLRESPKFSAIRMMGIVRSALLESGVELVAAGVLDRPTDLFYLRFRELKALAAGERQDWQSLVRERHRTYTREEHRQRIPRLLLSDGQAFYEGVVAPTETNEDMLGGSPVSPGMVEGVVHVVYDPYDARLAPGEILVCHGTDPAWTPLFLVAGGLVTEVGGLMTHGSVVAREYGIPAVVGVDQATTRLRTGQRVRVDGTTGQITILQEETE